MKKVCFYTFVELTEDLPDSHLIVASVEKIHPSINFLFNGRGFLLLQFPLFFIIFK